MYMYIPTCLSGKKTTLNTLEIVITEIVQRQSVMYNVYNTIKIELRWNVA